MVKGVVKDLMAKLAWKSEKTWRFVQRRCRLRWRADGARLAVECQLLRVETRDSEAQLILFFITGGAKKTSPDAGGDANWRK